MMEQEDTKLWELLECAPRRKAPEGFADAVMARIASEHQLPQSGRTGFAWAVWGAAAAALVAVAGLVSQMQTRFPADEIGAVASIDDEVLLDSAYDALGYEPLQDAVCSVSSPEMDNLGEADLAGIIF